MNDMAERVSAMREVILQKCRADVDTAESSLREPSESQRPGTFVAVVLTIASECVLRNCDVEIQPDFMVFRSRVRKEILHQENERSGAGFQAEFFANLAHDGIGTGFARFDAPARQRPEVVAFQTMEQHAVVATDDGGGTQVEAMAIRFEGNHGP
jgi:hypothetical protein